MRSSIFTHSRRVHFCDVLQALSRVVVEGRRESVKQTEHVFTLSWLVVYLHTTHSTHSFSANTVILPLWCQTTCYAEHNC